MSQAINPLKPDLYIAVLGAEGSGKTTYIAALLYSVMHADVAGGENIRMQFLEAEADEQLRQSAHQVIPTIQAKADETSGDYIRRIWKAVYQQRNLNYSGTVTGQDIFVKVRSDHSQLPLLKTEQIICVRDIPGGWVKDTSQWDEGSRRIRDQLRASNALIVILDAAALIADGGYNVEQDRLLEVLIKALDTYANEQQRQTRQSPLPVAVIFSKCDRLTPAELSQLPNSVHALRKSLNLCFRPEMVAYFNGSAFGADPTQLADNQPLPVTQSPFFTQIFAGFYHLFSARQRTYQRRLRWGSGAVAALLVLGLLGHSGYHTWRLQQQRNALVAQLTPELALPDYLSHLATLETQVTEAQHCWTCLGQTGAAKNALTTYSQQASQRLLQPFQQENSDQVTQSLEYYTQLAAQAQTLQHLAQRSHLSDLVQTLETTVPKIHCKQQFQAIRQQEQQIPTEYEARLKRWEHYLATCPHTAATLAQTRQQQAYGSWRLAQGQHIIDAIHNATSLEQAWQAVNPFLQQLPHQAEDQAIAQQLILALGQHALDYAKQPRQSATELQAIVQFAQHWPLLTSQWSLPPALADLSQAVADMGHEAMSKQSNLSFQAALASIQQIKGDCDRRLQSLMDLTSRYPRDPYKTQLDGLVREEYAACDRQHCQQIREQAPYLDAPVLEQQVSQLIARYPQTQCGTELKTLLTNRQQDHLWEELRLIQAKQVNADSETAFDGAETAYKGFILRYQGNAQAESAIIKAQHLLSQIGQHRQNWLLTQINQCWQRFLSSGKDLMQCSTAGKAYLTRYPDPHPATVEIEKMLSFITSISQRGSYSLRLVEGSFPRKLKPDAVFVTVDINGERLTACTPQPIRSETPAWNHTCTVPWKTQDKITLSAWAQASWGDDTLLLQREFTGHLGLTQLCGWLKSNQPEPVIWNDTASEWVKVRPAQQDNCNAWLPPLPQLTTDPKKP